MSNSPGKLQFLNKTAPRNNFSPEYLRQHELNAERARIMVNRSRKMYEESLKLSESLSSSPPSISYVEAQNADVRGESIIDNVNVVHNTVHYSGGSEVHESPMTNVRISPRQNRSPAMIRLVDPDEERRETQVRIHNMFGVSPQLPLFSEQKEEINPKIREADKKWSVTKANLCHAQALYNIEKTEENIKRLNECKIANLKAKENYDTVRLGEKYVETTKNLNDSIVQHIARPTEFSAQRLVSNIAEHMNNKIHSPIVSGKCTECAKILPDYAAEASCGCLYHRECLMKRSVESHYCHCLGKLSPAVVGRKGVRNEPLKLRSPDCQACLVFQYTFHSQFPTLENVSDYGLVIPKIHYTPGQGFDASYHTCERGEKNVARAMVQTPAGGQPLLNRKARRALARQLQNAPEQKPVPIRERVKQADEVIEKMPEDVRRTIQSLKDEVRETNKKLRDLNVEKVPIRNNYTEANQKLGGYRNQYGPLVVSRALDLGFTTSGMSEYFLKMVCPDRGPAFIPDNIVQKCVLKSETITSNINVGTSGTGCFILLPKNDSSLIGYHYVGTVLGGFAFERKLVAAQTLSENYDFARKQAQFVTIKSSTIAGGTFALNGTMNAVEVQGTLSDLLTVAPMSDFYSTLLSTTTDPFEKVGNVLASTGVGVLSIMPSVGQRFTRLSDPSPASTHQVSLIENSIDDLTQSSRHHLRLSGSLISTNSGSATGNFQFNVDSTTGVEILMNFNVVWPIAVNAPCSITALFTLMDPFGNVITTPGDNGLINQVVMPGASVGTDNYRNSATFVYSLRHLDGPPIASISVNLVASSLGPLPEGHFVASLDCMVPNAFKEGSTKPIVVVAYQGMSPGSVLTVSGVANYELIPNAKLRQNIPLSDSFSNKDELEYCNELIANKYKIGLRTIYALPDYFAMIPIFEELANVTNHDKARALSGADIVKFLKQRVVPKLLMAGGAAVKTLFPIAGPAIDVFSQGQSKVGVPKSIAMMEKVEVENDNEGVNIDRNEIVLRTFVSRAMDRKPSSLNKTGVIQPVKWRAVAFPTIVTAANSLIMKGGELQVASNVRPIGFVDDIFTETIDGYRIWGVSNDDVFSHKLGTDIYVFCVDPIAFAMGRIEPTHGNMVTGHSGDAAIWLTAHGKFSGYSRIALTGSLDDKLNVVPSLAFDEKARWLSTRNILLAGNDVNGKPVVRNVQNVLGGLYYIPGQKVVDDDMGYSPGSSRRGSKS